MRTRAGIALILFACAGEDENCLDGSIGVDLSFDQATVRLITDDLVITYWRSVDGGKEKTAELVVNGVAESLAGDFELALEPVTTEGGNATIGRSVTDASTFPDFVGGTLVIEEGGSVGSSLAGRFGLEFVTGATLSGCFKGVLTQVSQP